MKEKRNSKRSRNSKKKKVEILEEKPGNLDVIFRSVVIITGVIILAIILFNTFNNLSKSFEHNGVQYDIVEFCDSPPCLKTYNTKIPVIHEEKEVSYNFYLRNDPRRLEKEVPFEGFLNLGESLTLEITYDQFCEGYSSIAVENFGTLIGILGINTTTSQEAEGCSFKTNDMHIMIQQGEETNVEQIAPFCYKINIKECEILKGTERFMTEIFERII